MYKIKRIIYLSIVIITASCAGVGVVSTDDPYKKLKHANILLEKEGRPVLAERLITEAISIFKQKNDQAGLAEGFRQYGLFLRSHSLNPNSPYFIKYGFIDKDVSYKDRSLGSIKYFKKSLKIYKELNDTSMLTNIYFLIGGSYSAGLNDNLNGCKFYKKSIESNIEYTKENPDINIPSPEGFYSYEDFMIAVMKQSNCK